jgi:hypothetical protein
VPGSRASSKLRRIEVISCLEFVTATTPVIRGGAGSSLPIAAVSMNQRLPSGPTVRYPGRHGVQGARTW